MIVFSGYDALIHKMLFIKAPVRPGSESHVAILPPIGLDESQHSIKSLGSDQVV